MNDHTALQATLEEELTTLTTALSSLGIQDPRNSTNWITVTPASTEADPNSVADSLEDYEEDRATLALMETRFNAIKRALEKFQNGTYGICEVGGEPIEAARLAANPAARTCVTHMDVSLDL